jgi:hypothetical protein
MSRLATAFALLTLTTTASAVVVPGVALARAFAKAPPGHAAAPSPTAVAEAIAASPSASLIELDRAAVMDALRGERRANLARFHAYATAGVYPSNTYRPGLANVWRDDAGHYCAAASMIAASGQADLVIETGDRDVFIRLRDVTSGPLHEWILTSGLTRAEVDLIQRPFKRVSPPEPATAIAAGATPTRPAVDPALRRKETKRLRALYAKIEAQLGADTDAPLALATDELMARPMLALARFGDRVRALSE